MNATNQQEKHGRRGRQGLRVALGSLLGALALPACANRVSVPAEIATCPCATGAFCCSSGVCASDATGCDVATAALSNSVAGEWQGYFENFSLSTDDSLAISIVVAADGTMSGHVTIGQTPAPTPPTDPDAVWPPGLEVTQPAAVLPPYVAGFAYQARNIRWEAQRLRFEITADEAWQPWCALQTPVVNTTGFFTPVGSYNCIPDPLTPPVQQGGQCFSNLDTGTTPCFKVFLFCTLKWGPCTCGATGCQASEANTYSFDIALRDGIGDGTSSLTTSPIRLNQASQN